MWTSEQLSQTAESAGFAAKRTSFRTRTGRRSGCSARTKTSPTKRRLSRIFSAAKELYQRIIEGSPEGIVTFDAQHAITFVNSRMAQILGYSMEELTGMHAAAFVDDETHAVLGGYRQRAGESVSEHCHASLRTKEGALVQVLVSASPLIDGNGDCGGAVAMVTDITAVREAEDIVRSQSLRMHAEVGKDELGEKPPGP